MYSIFNRYFLCCGRCYAARWLKNKKCSTFLIGRTRPSGFLGYIVPPVFTANGNRDFWTRHCALLIGNSCIMLFHSKCCDWRSEPTIERPIRTPTGSCSLSLGQKDCCGTPQWLCKVQIKCSVKLKTWVITNYTRGIKLHLLTHLHALRRHDALHVSTRWLQHVTQPSRA